MTTANNNCVYKKAGEQMCTREAIVTATDGAGRRYQFCLDHAVSMNESYPNLKWKEILP